MVRIVVFGLGLLAACRAVSPVGPEKKETVVRQSSEHSVRGVVFSYDRSDGDAPMSRSFELERSGLLKYSAYYYNMPINMNHNDGIEWQAGEHGRKLLDAAAALVDLPDSGLEPLAESAPRPTGKDGVFLVQLTRKNADSTRAVTDPRSKAWKALQPAFTAMAAAFRKATGRPLSPTQLPQGR